MDLKSIAEKLNQMPMSAHFTVCYVIVCTMNTRADLGTGSIYFSRKHPLACWLSTLLCTFSSTILTNFLLNEPIVSAFINTQQVIVASVVWYLIFYSPFDIAYRICNFMPIKAALNCVSEVYNCRSIYDGIVHAGKVFPDSYIIMAIVGIVTGNSAGFIRIMERLIRGSWSLNVLEFLHPTYSTKISALVTITFIANKYMEYFMVSQPFVLFCMVSICIYSKLSAIVLDVNDPFSPIENLVCLLLFGGIWDALSRAIALEEQSQSAQEGNLKSRAMKADILMQRGVGSGGDGRGGGGAGVRGLLTQKPITLTKPN